MRSDKEQLDIILQKKNVTERKRIRNRRIIFSSLALLLCFSVTLTVALTIGKSGRKSEMNFAPDDTEGIYGNVDNTDGVIGGGNKVPGEHAGDEAPTFDGYYEYEDEEIVLEDTIGSVPETGVPTPDKAPHYEGNSQPTSGTLSGGEINDNNDYDTWLETAKDENWNELGKHWQLPTNKRITVKVKDCAGALVKLLDAKGDVLYCSVTNMDGVAYLFADEQAQIKTVTVMAGGKSASTDYSGDEYSFDMEKQGVSKKLDLMFVVDTTGSMGDELGYLKVEIADVIDRISKNNIDVRTSVNFYRDEGDEYVVKYFGFNDDAPAVQGILKQQSADGGGDYEEAVHTALHNAVFNHAWEENSVKVMFLVLDAPPHDVSDVIHTLSIAVKQAAAMGIRIVPVASSGVDKNTEGLLRNIALYTGGTYAFLTDHSGIGGSHLPPSTESYEVEPLNDMLVRIALEYCGIKTEKTKYPTVDSTESSEYSQ